VRLSLDYESTLVCVCFPPHADNLEDDLDIEFELESTWSS
jgi:hypothetical protein